MQHIITVEGRSLIRTFLAGATKGAAVCLVSGEHLERMQFIVECGIEYGCQIVTQFPQFPRLPLYKEKLRILPKLRKNE